MYNWKRNGIRWEIVNKHCTVTPPSRRRGGLKQLFILEGSAPRSNPLPFYHTILDRKGTCLLVCLRSKRFRAVSEQRTRNDCQRPRENGASKRAGRGWGWKVPFLARPKPQIPFFDLPLLRSQTETLVTQAISWSRILISSQLISWLALDWCSQTADDVCFFDVRSLSSSF